MLEGQTKGIIFDLDGTIVDSMAMWRELDKNFITSLGYEFDIKVREEIVGLTLSQAAQKFKEIYNMPMTKEDILKEWNEYLLDSYTNSISLKKNADRAIDRWNEQGIKMCVATLTDKPFAKIILEKYGLLNKMEFILTVGEVGKDKRNPDIYLECAKRMELSPQDCVVIEDTYHAIKAAKSVGFTVYGIYEPTAPHKDEIAGACDKYFADFKEIM